MIVWLLFLTLCVYQALDVWQSYWLFKVGAEELNPLVAAGMDEGGILFLVYLKTLWILILFLGLLIQRRKSKEVKKTYVL
jgi:hypothetical protein